MKTVAVLCALFAAALAQDAADGPDNCYQTCSGIARNWSIGDHTGGDEMGMVKVVVDMTACGFKSAPIVSAMLNGESHNVQTKGAASGIRELTATGFHLNIHKHIDEFQITPDMVNGNWELNWTASSYGC